ncbi:MAG TPA: tetratricopeptide repeat protein, partial [Flavisolibacter sp.]|nr:tetratricopeptide repeat protein [Flavisolibacter sp.]
RLFLDNLASEERPAYKQWAALQAKDLFERSLKMNPNNDSSKVGLGAVYLYGGIAMPMQGIGMIREVADRDSTNIYAQMTLGQASIASSQLDKAVDRFKTVIRLQPDNAEAVLLLAETYEQMGDKNSAIGWYKKSLPLIKIPELKKEVEARIAELSK